MAVGLALGVGTLAIAPALVQRVVDASGSTAADAAEVSTGPTSAEVEQREAAVLLAATTSQQASEAAAAAVASSVSGEALTPLETAVERLSTLVSTVQASQPAFSQLTAHTTDASLPVQTVEMAAAAVDAATEAADAAASGADVTSDEVEGDEVEGTATADADATDSATDSTTDDASSGTATSEAVAAEDATTSASPEPSATASTAAADATATGTASAAATAATDDADPLAATLSVAVERVATLTAEVQTVTQQAAEAAAASAAADAAAAAALKEEQATSLDSYENGQIPASALCELDFAEGEMLRCDAAEALDALAVAYQAEFGTVLVISDSYRSYAEQVACRAQKGSLCATPGTSNHGLGTAVDLGGNASSFNTDEHDWLMAHAEEYGWTLPDWAQATGSKPEPWHWEYVG
ncbi:MAG TPA: M15 family metallopeptidase [Cellulomonas sp.]